MSRNRLITFVAVILVATVVVAGCAPAATPAPAAPAQEPARTPAASPGSPVATADLWDQIQKQGTLRVGTSGDYAPFAFYNRRHRLDGFDVGLIKEMGKQLGVEVQIKDYAFDGLYNALQLGSIDVAIAAISVTAERAKVVDFTNVYYVGKGAAIANEKSPLSAVTNVEQLAQWMLGVQSGSVYQKYLEDALVKTGKMPAENLQAYPDVDQAVSALKRLRVDVVVLDSQPAQAYVDEGGLKLVGDGVNAQAYAIAVPKGAESLRRMLNTALADTIADGEYARLAEKYLGLKPGDVEPLPTPAPGTPVSAPQPTTAPVGCTDNAAYVADLTYDDMNMTAPPVLRRGESFVKTWRVRDSGTCAWDSSYSLSYASGDSPLAQMSGQPTKIQGTVAPGETYDISVNLVAPTSPGVYQGFWQMKNGKGSAFGAKIYVGIQVQAPAPTPAPTSPPSPSITFTVDRTSITAGECVVFRWDVKNVEAVYFYSAGENMLEHGVAGQGSQTECPQQSTNYYLTVKFPNGTSETKATGVAVAPAPVDAPMIALFSVTPPQVQLGQCVTLQWSTVGSIQRIDISRSGTLLWGGAPVAGTLQDCPPVAGTTGYTLLATGAGGQSYGQQNVYVVGPPTPVPPTAAPPTAVPPTAAPQPPAIAGKNWLLLTYNNGQDAMVSALAGTTVTALFGTDGKVTGSDGCNTYNAVYTATGDTLMVTLPVTTGAACGEDIAAQARTYLAELQLGRTYQVLGSTLTIFDASGQKLLQYEAQ